MLLASLGIHVGLLLLPMAASNDEALPPPDLEQDNIAITRIPPTAPSNPRALASTPVAAAQIRPTPTTAPLPAQSGATATSSRPTTQGTRQNRTDRGVRSHPSTPLSQGAVPNLNQSSRSVSPNPPALPLPSVEPQPFNPMIHQRLLAHAQTLTLPPIQIAQLAGGLSQWYAYSPANTSGTDFSANLSRWIEAVKQAAAQPNLWNEPLEPPLTVEHYRRVCLMPAPQTAVVGVVVSPSGALQGEPTLLQSTGYGFLNTVVLDAVKRNSFPAPGELKAYTVDVTVRVDYGSLDCLKPYVQPSTAAHVPANAQS